MLQIVCAGCKKEMGTKPSDPGINGVSHTMCCACIKKTMPTAYAAMLASGSIAKLEEEERKR